MYLKYIKPVIDVVFALLCFPVFLIVYFIVVILVKIEDGGSVFFKGTRIGKDMKAFKMYKFRSMFENAPDIRNPDGSTFNDKNDKRLTKVGRFLRMTSIDELPQILNILRGEMSLVGPRPSPTGNFHLYSEEYKQKFSVRPGITGYNQAYFRNSIPDHEKKNNDIFYVTNLSFWFDLRIILRTILTVLCCKSVYSVQQKKRRRKK